VPSCISPTATVAFAADSRELVVEYLLPTVDVIPVADSYRYDKERDAVVATPRPASQVKAWYANTIAQLALLSLAAILALDIEHHIEIVVFNGVVDALDPRSGQPIRPCLITARVTADAFAELDVANASPSACLDRLSVAVSQNPAELVPVRPLPE
jgi:restriction system protein